MIKLFSPLDYQKIAGNRVISHILTSNNKQQSWQERVSIPSIGFDF
jgi:hypothetical protein